MLEARVPENLIFAKSRAYPANTRKHKYKKICIYEEIREVSKIPAHVPLRMTPEWSRDVVLWISLDMAVVRGSVCQWDIDSIANSSWRHVRTLDDLRCQDSYNIIMGRDV